MSEGLVPAGICPTHICIEVELDLCDSEMPDRQRMSAYVIHRSDQGVGPMFVMPGDGQLRSNQ